MSQLVVTINLTAGDPFSIVTGLGSCVEQALNDIGRPVCRACLAVPGQIAWDQCDCDCGGAGSGQLALTVPNMYPSRTFPIDGSTDGNQDVSCALPWLVFAVTVELTRCVPSITAEGNPPPCDDLSAAAADWWTDVITVRKALGCCLKAMLANRTIVKFALGGSVAKGPEGGCAGSETSLLVGIPNCVC